MDVVLRRHRPFLDVVFAFYATGGVDQTEHHSTNRSGSEAKLLRCQASRRLGKTANANGSGGNNNSGGGGSSGGGSSGPGGNSCSGTGTAPSKEVAAVSGPTFGLSVGSKLGALRRRAHLRVATRLEGHRQALAAEAKAAARAASVAHGETHGDAVATNAHLADPEPPELPPGLRLGLDGWARLLADAGLCGQGQAPWGRQLSGRDARAAWCLARRVVVDASGFDAGPPPLNPTSADDDDDDVDKGADDTRAAADASAAAAFASDAADADATAAAEPPAEAGNAEAPAAPAVGTAAAHAPSPATGARAAVAGAGSCRERHAEQPGDSGPVRPFAGGAYPGNGAGLDRLAFYEALSRCAELMAKDLPLPFDLKHHQVS
jgi:hypothetical protein